MEITTDSIGREPSATGASRAPATVYTRTMPGGGYVRVELLRGEPGASGSSRSSGRVVIEPRDAASRRAEAAPLVVEEVEGEDENSVLSELFRIARDNAAIARRVLQRRSAIQRAD